MNNVDEQELIRGLLARDEQAYAAAVRSYHGGMLRFARAIVGDAIAEEVVQEAWIAILKGLSDFEGRSSLKTWIYSVLGNIARSRRRREARTVSMGDGWSEDNTSPLASRFDEGGHWSDPPVPWHEESPEALLSSEELRRCLEKLLAALPEAQRSVLTLRDAEGLEMDRICNILGISETNARVLLHRARTRLRAGVERHVRGEEC